LAEGAGELPAVLEAKVALEDHLFESPGEVPVVAAVLEDYLFELLWAAQAEGAESFYEFAEHLQRPL